MTGSRIGENPSLPMRKTTISRASTWDAVVVEVDFRSIRRERIYDADKVWSGEQSILDFTEV